MTDWIKADLAAGAGASNLTFNEKIKALREKEKLQNLCDHCINICLLFLYYYKYLFDIVINIYLFNNVSVNLSKGRNNTPPWLWSMPISTSGSGRQGITTYTVCFQMLLT